MILRIWEHQSLDDLQRWPLNNAYWLAIDSQYNGADCTCIEMQHIWWRHDDVIKWKHFSALLALCEGNPLVTDEFPSQRPLTRSFDVFFDLRLNKRLSKHSRRRWFETPSRSLWRHCIGVCRSWESMPFSFQNSKCHELSRLVHYCALLWFVTGHFNHNPVPLKLMISSGTPVSSGVSFGYACPRFYHIPNSTAIIIYLVQRQVAWPHYDFVHAKTAHLSRHEQNSFVIGLIRDNINKRVSLEFEIGTQFERAGWGLYI